MRDATKAKVGDYVGVPTRLLFPNRVGRWSRYDYQDGKVIAVGESKKRPGVKVIKVVYYDTWRAATFTEAGELIPTGEKLIMNFYADACYMLDMNFRKFNCRYKYLLNL